MPKVWIATCNWGILAYPDTGLFLTVELTPDAAGARMEFDSERAKMEITQPAIRQFGYGQEAVFDIDRRGDVAIIILQGAEVITIELSSTSKPAPPAASRMRMAKAAARLIMKQYGKG